MHYTLLVTGDNPDEQLEPYQENNMGNCGPDYLEFIIQDEEDLYNTSLAVYRDGNWYTTYTTTPDTKTWKEVCSYDEYMKRLGYEYNEEEEAWGYWGNPNAKWDWYQMGGRWYGYFQLLDGKSGILGERSLVVSFSEQSQVADSALKKDINWDKKSDYVTYAILHEGEWYEDNLLGAPLGGDWQEFWINFVDRLPPTTRLTVFDCHI